MSHNSSDSPDTPESQPQTEAARPILQNEDWWAVAIGGLLLLVWVIAVVAKATPEEVTSPLHKYVSKPGSWESSPVDAILPDGKTSKAEGIFGVFAIAAVLFTVASQFIGRNAVRYLSAFPPMFVLATAAFVMASQTLVKYYSLSYALWALLLGLIISNTIRTPAFLKPAVRTELYIKTGLVILGAEVLFTKLLALGMPGIFVAWVVTPTVLLTTFWFGQKILKIPSASLNMVVSADMSVCGVSAAIATAAACKAKKEELSLAIGLSLIFTVVMMVVMPAVIKASGMSLIVGGAWMGGTIDATGAVAAAGALLGDEALTVATTIKMIQNILIGVIAFGVAVYWVNYQTPSADGVKPDASEIWRRFPKFVLGFVAASLVFSAIYSLHNQGPEIVKSVIGDTKTFRSWFFCLAFVSIGLETNFRDLSKQLQGGKPLVLYLCGQSLNLILTLLMSWLMFELVFPNAADALSK